MEESNKGNGTRQAKTAISVSREGRSKSGQKKTISYKESPLTPYLRLMARVFTEFGYKVGPRLREFMPLSNR